MKWKDFVILFNMKIWVSRLLNINAFNFGWYLLSLTGIIILEFCNQIVAFVIDVVHVIRIYCRVYTIFLSLVYCLVIFFLNSPVLNRAAWISVIMLKNELSIGALRVVISKVQIIIFLIRLSSYNLGNFWILAWWLNLGALYL